MIDTVQYTPFIRTLMWIYRLLMDVCIEHGIKLVKKTRLFIVIGVCYIREVGG